jgi:hypothetical protein
VHVMLNMVHPENGLRLDDNFEWVRAQAWALEYERENDRIYCEERLKNAQEREESPTRPAWLAFHGHQIKFEHDEKILENQNPILIGDREIPENANNAEWKILKEIQRCERREFFAQGKVAFKELRNSIYREIREEFREDWSNFYSLQKTGIDASMLANIKAGIIEEQKEVLEERRDEACLELRETRNGLYRELLDDQREMRLGLRSRQEAGLDNSFFLDLAKERDVGSASRSVTDMFREAAAETTARQDADERGVDIPGIVGSPSPMRQGHDGGGIRGGVDVGADFASGIGFGAISFLESLADGFIGSKPAPKPQRPEPDRPDPNPFDAIIDEARARQHREQEEADREWRKRQRSHGD